MREMKDSGIARLGIIPLDWVTPRIKHIFSEIGSGTTPTSGKEYYYDNGIYYWIQSGDLYKTKYIYDTEKKLTERAIWTFSALKEYKSDFLVIAMYGASIGNVSISKINARTNQACCAIKPKEFLDLEFLYYALCTDKDIMLDMSIGGTQPNISQAKILELPIPLPSIIEQRHISSFLDTKCSEIDSLVLNIQSQIETLEEYKHSVITEVVTKGLDPNVEMKDSGVQWIGEMPVHWDCQRGKYILRYVQKPVREDDGVITCFRDGEVTLRSNRREEGFTMADKEIGYQGIDVGDLVVHGMDGFAGAIGISDSRGKASPVLNVLNTEQSKRYIMYYLRSMAYNDVFVALATGIRVRSCDLRWNKLAELRYPLPPIEEQQAIVEYIDSVMERTNAIIAEKKQQIETIEEYKKSLIFEYVTGKKEVQA